MSTGDSYRVAIVTGAARNIGRAAALALARQGFAVLVHSGSDKEGAEETAGLVEQAGPPARVTLGDLTEEATSARLVEAAAALGRPAVLVNNAALRRAVPFEEMDLAEWRAVLAVNLDAAFLCSRAVIAPMLEAGWGRIINIGGLSGHRGAAKRAHVVASKAALVGLSKALAIEYAGRGVTANCVVPGEIETRRGASAGARGQHPDKALPPVGRRGTPEEVAAVIALLCGPESDYLTGQTFHVNGGVYLP
ncbi:SDR family oxidoreductase [Pelagibius marinus]|uniref:SDR family oxidoreductase n=1 Tax=Pelagibius marinus TaxID=2762760 RepID=UPI0018731054|nr:SDR family oxidoreductase [Pelagibius marinus]